MKIQLALDRLQINEALSIAKQVSDYVDWIEVGTSMIKEFGVQSVIAIRNAFPKKIIVADTKTFDNGAYEMNLYFDAGADVTTVMGAAPLVTIETCRQIAEERGKRIMIDLLETSQEKQTLLPSRENIVWCFHLSKDEQEANGAAYHLPQFLLPDSSLCPIIALAGGIQAESLNEIRSLNPDVIIVGAYITNSSNPARAAEELRRQI